MNLFFISSVMFMSIAAYPQDNVDNLNPQTRAFLQELVQDYEFCQQQSHGVSSVVTVDAKNFESEVLMSDKPVIVDIYGVWCGPCDIFKVIYAKVAADFMGQVKFVAIDYDSYPELVEKYSIDSVPHLMFFYDGLCVTQLSGVQLSKDLATIVEHFVEFSQQANAQ